MNRSRHITEEELEQIDKYLHKELTDAERIVFEERLAADAEWREKTEEVKLLSLGIQEEVLLRQLPSFYNALPASGNPVKPKLIRVNWMKRMTLAATLVLGVTTITWLVFFHKTANEKLFAAYYSPDPGLPTLMGVSDHYEFENAMVEYKTGHYAKALQTWSALLQDHPENDTLHYFIASAYLAQKQDEQAALYFDKVIRQQQSVFLQDALWYKALLLLKQGKKEQAIPLLKATEHADKEALLRKLKS